MSASPSTAGSWEEISTARCPERAARTAAAVAVVVVPAPPGPVNSSLRTPAQPSTRFLSSLSAVSRMTFSALRLIIPSIGMCRSMVRS